VHVTPVKALLSELAEHHGERVVHLFWGVSTREDLYDLESLREHAARCSHAFVHAVVARGPAHPYTSGSLPPVVVDFGEWTSHDVYLSGSPPRRRRHAEHAAATRVDPWRVHTVTLEPVGTR
jgi:NAD(P)H-flavin reductase